MDVNSPQPTILHVIKFCVWLSSLYDQDLPFLDYVNLFIAVVAVFIVVGNHLLKMDWSVVIPQGNIICIPVRGSGVGGVSFVQLSPLIYCHRCSAHSRGKSPICKGLVCRNPSGHHYLPPGGRGRRGWSVLFRVSFVQLYPIFCRCRRRAHSFPELLLGKGWVGCNPSGHYHMRPRGRSRRVLSFISTNLSYFLSLFFYCRHRRIHIRRGVF